MCTVSISVVII